MQKRLFTRLGTASIAALVLVALTAPSATGASPTEAPASSPGGSSSSERRGHGSAPGLEPTGADMDTVGGNLGNQHYSGLTDISARNLSKLAPAWRTHVSAVAPATDDVGQQTTPIVIDGVIFLDTPSGGVIAVDGASGESVWKWQPTEFETVGTRRGVSAGEGKIYTLADGDRVVALDQATGEQVWVAQPTTPEGESLGNLERVATVYHDGIVYAHAANGDRAAVVGLDASDGSYLWHFFGGPDRDAVYTDVNGNSVAAGETWGPPQPDGTECALVGGATPWIHGAVDPELGMYYMTFGNARSCTSSQDGSQRPGDNLFSSTLVAVDAATGEYKWHYQSIRHDVWDMDNVHPPTLANIKVKGEKRQVLFYGSKSGHQFVLDRTNGTPVLPVVEKEMITDSRQNHAETQPFPEKRLLPECVVWQKLDPKKVPGDPWRAVPNYNGYQPDADGNLVFNPDSYVAADEPFLTYPDGYKSDHREGCMYDPQWDLPILSTTSQNGGGDWSNNAFSHRTNLVYFPYGTNPVAHWNGAAANGQRAIGQYQTGGILGYDASTGKVKWRNHLGTDMSHGQGPLVTASDLLFAGQIDGRLLALDARNGKQLWEFQTGTGIASAPITYEVDGEQYVAVFSAGSTNPYGASVTQGDSLWAFKVGGRYTTDSGSPEGADPAPLAIRRPVSGAAVEGSTVNNTVLLARPDRTSDTAAARDSVLQNAMQPTHIRVPVGSTVTFLNPGTETFPNSPNQLEHCATQFFEGEFNARLQPGESYKHTFTRAGEYFFNDCTDPRPTGKVEVYLAPQEAAGALKLVPSRLDFEPKRGSHAVTGTVLAYFQLPRGHRYDGGAQLIAPLSTNPVEPTRAVGVGNHVLLTFDKADLDHNLPEGSTNVTVTLRVQKDGVQKLLTSTATVRVVK